MSDIQALADLLNRYAEVWLDEADGDRPAFLRAAVILDHLAAAPGPLRKLTTAIVKDPTLYPAAEWSDWLWTLADLTEGDTE